MGTITGNTRRTANIGSSGGSGSAVKTIYTDNDTIDDQIREVSLYGNTSSDKLIFQNLAGADIISLYGNRTIDFGTSSNYITPNFYLDSTNTVTCQMYSGSNAFAFINAVAYNFTIYNPAASGQQVNLDGQLGRIYTRGTYAGYYSYNSAGTQTITMDIQSNSDGYFVLKSGSTNKIALYAGYANYFMDSVSIGDTYTFTAKLKVKGSGSTSATTTALFENSSSVNALKIRGDNYIIQRAINAAIADADLSNNEMSAYIDEATSFLIFKVKTSTGVVKTASIGLV